MLTICIPNVDAYEARTNYWSGEILKGVAGNDLYLNNEKEAPFGFKIHCDESNKPYSIEFANGTLWSFCAPDNARLNQQWPLFLKSMQEEKAKARVSRIYSDGMYVNLVIDKYIMSDLLIWKYPPSARGA